MNPKQATLIISTYNWPEALDLVLQSFLHQSQMPLEVIIADDGSKQPTIDLVKKYQQNFPVPLIHQWHKDDGFRKSVILNKCIKNAKGDYIIQIDGDIILHKDFIKDHCRYAVPGYFVKGSRGRLSKKKSEIVLQKRQTKIHPLEIGVLSRINATHLPLLAPLLYGDEHNTRNIKGCNFAFWKADAIAVNGYNNELQGWGHEDIEFAARLANLGKKRRQLKLAAVCYHIHHELVSRNNENRNLKVYEQVVKDKVVRCAHGIDRV